MKMNNTSIQIKDLTKLALAATDIVNAIELETTDFAATKVKFLAMLDQLEAEHEGSELLFDARAAILSQPTRKMDIYIMARKLIKLARAGSPKRSVAERFSVPGAMMLDLGEVVVENRLQ